jgi:hypothetical protein
MDAERAQEVYDRLMISEVVSRFFIALDRKDWEGLRSVVADNIALTNSQTEGPPTAATPADVFVRETQERHGGLTGALHYSTNHLISIAGDAATVETPMSALHWVGDNATDSYSAAGMYEIGLVRTSEGWRVGRLFVEIWREEGDPDHVHSVAAERMSGRSPS